MRIPKTLMIGLIGALLVGATEAVAEMAVGTALAAEPETPIITVPAGHIGDRVVYNPYSRTREGVEWLAQAHPDMEWVRAETPVWLQVIGQGRAFDRTGDAHDVVTVLEDAWRLEWREGLLQAESGDIINGTSLNAYSLASRDIISSQEDWAIEEKSFFTVTENYGGIGITPGPFQYAQTAEGPVYRAFIHGLHQGATYHGSDDATIWAQRRIVSDFDGYDFAPSTPAKDVLQRWNLTVSGIVGDAAIIGNRVALPVKLEGCIDLPERSDQYLPVELLYQSVPSPSHTCFDYIEWVTADSPYPIRVESRMDFTRTGSDVNFTHAEALLDMVEFHAGSAAIPWRMPPTSGVYATEAPAIERSPGGQRHPSDGSTSGVRRHWGKRSQLLQAPRISRGTSSGGRDTHLPS